MPHKSLAEVRQSFDTTPTELRHSFDLNFNETNFDNTSTKLIQNFEKTGILKAFLPKNFLREIEHRMETDGDNPALIEKMQQEWLKSFEKDHESVFVLWNAELR